MADTSRRRDGEAPTNYRLAIHVVAQAVRDLDVKPSNATEAQAIHEARLFWLSETGGWAASRRMWLRLAGYDPDKATAIIRAKLAAEGITLDEPIPQPPQYVFNDSERRILRRLPRGEVFFAEDTPLPKYPTYRDRLIAKGALQRLDRGLYIVPRSVEIFAKVGDPPAIAS